jgi:hypothetical protein
MADTRQRTTWGNRFRFLIRAAGLTGTAAVAAGGILAAASLPPVDLRSRAGWEAIPAVLHAASNGDHGDLARVAAWMIAGGAAAVALALVVEVGGAVLLGVGRRTAAGTTATVGVAAALVLLGLVNVYSGTHYGRFDCTRDERFTLRPGLAAEFAALRANAPTTVVVLQKHRMFGTLSDERDSYTKAAEEKVTEKVKDLVDQFREFGPRFHVAVLDAEAFGYADELDALTTDAPELRDAIKAAPENSIFFHANKRVQRLSFNEFLQLDKKASRAADGRGANLVLLPQGVDTFARRILAVQERRPKVAVCVVHEWLTSVATEGQEEFSLAGLKRALTDQGFDVVDIVLKKNWSDPTKELEPAAYSLDENKLERIEGDADAAREALEAARDDIRILEKVTKAADEAKDRPWRDRAEFYTQLNRGTRQREWTELIAAFDKWVAGGRPVSEANEAEFRALLLAGLKKQTALAESQVKEAEKEQQEADEKLKAAYRDERTLQDRRVPDVKAKFTRLLADVDLLVIPRYTVVNATIGRVITPTLHKMDKQQVEVVKEFMKAGKPVLACMGPISSQTGPQADAIDGFEQLLRERGVELGRETVLYDGERKAFAAARSGVMLFSGAAQIPPLLLGAPAGDRPLAPNPIAATLRLTGRTAEQSLDLQVRAPRPVYLAPGWQDRMPARFELTDRTADALKAAEVPDAVLAKLDPLKNKDFSRADLAKQIAGRLTPEEAAKFLSLILDRTRRPFEAEFLFTPPGAWNEERPFVVNDRAGRVTYIPRYEPTPADDPKRNTHAEERKASFPVAVAVESKIPAVWASEDAEALPLAAVLGPLDRGPTFGLAQAAEAGDRPVQRTVVFGSGHLFNGAKLEPPREQLLLHTVNWLTGRADRLPKPASDDRPEWKYPRVAMSDGTRTLWRLGTAVGMPLTVAYVGLLATMRRRMR